MSLRLPEFTSSRSTAPLLTAALAAIHGFAPNPLSAASADVLAATGDEPVSLPGFTVDGEKIQGPTTPKFTEPLRDTPQTVVLIPSEVYLQQGAMTLSDVLRNSAGITFAAGEGGNASATSGDSFYIRGYDTTANIFVDSVRDVGAYSRDVFNIEQVEITKGPAGADIGRGGATGYVNLVTKMPRLETFTAGTLAYGFDEETDGRRERATLDLNQPVPSSPVAGTAFRLNAMIEDNAAIGREFATQKAWSVAPSLALGLGTPTRAFASYQHTEQDSLPDYGLPSALLPGYVSSTPVPHVDRATFYGFTSDHDRVQADAAEFRLEHDFSRETKLSNQTRYSANQRDAVVTTPGTSSAAYVPATGLLTRSRQANKRDLGILSNQTNFRTQFATGPVRHHLTSGLEFARETAYSPAFVSAVLTPILLENPDPNSTPGGAPTRSGAYTDVVTKTAALYLFDTLHFGDRWQFSAGLRGERYQTHALSVDATGLFTPIDADHNLLSWKSGLVFKPTKDGSLYVAYANSLTPPGSEFTVSSVAGNQNHPDSDPQETTNLEAGVKWEFFNGRLSTNAAAFRIVNDRTVFTDPVLGLVPVGRQTVEGVELGLSRRFTDNWIVLGSISYLESEINSGTTAGGNPAGSSLPLIPRWSGNLYTSYRFASGLLIGGSGQYSSEVARRDNNAPAVPRTMPSYWLFNAVISYPVTKAVTVRLNVNNIFNEEYSQNFNNNGARFLPGAPRSYLVSADFRF